MNHELIELTRRVKALEQAQSSSRDRGLHRRARGYAVGLLAWASAAAMAALLFLWLSPSSAAAQGKATVKPGPTMLSAPVYILGTNGNVLMRVAEAPGGMMSMYNDDQKEVVRIGRSPTGCCGSVLVYEDETWRAGLGVDEDGKGMLRLQGPNGMYAQASGAGFAVAKDDALKVAIRLNESGVGTVTLNAGSGQRALAATGLGQIFARNSAGHEVASLGVDNANQGYFIADDEAGLPKATLSIGSDGTGMAQVFKSKELAVIMGTKDGTKGDVCANGPQASVCLSTVAIKTFSKY